MVIGLQRPPATSHRSLRDSAVKQLDSAEPYWN
jgi:hypothetical protein